MIVVAIAIAACAFLFRFNVLGGALGGFDNEEFATLTRVDMVLDGQQPFRDFVDGELRAAWPSLSFEVPALAQRIWGRNLFVYACVTLGGLALCAALVFIVAREISGSWLMALAAAAATVLSMTVSYNYQKVLPLTLGAGALYLVMLRPTMVRLGVLAVATAAAALFRHDYGVYVALAACAGLIGLEPRPWPVPLRRIAIYVAMVGVLALPSIWWMEQYGGLAQYLREAIASVRVDTRTNPPLGLSPRLDWRHPLAVDSLLAFNYYGYWVMTLAATVLLAVRWRGRRERVDPVIGLGCALVIMTPIVNYLFLRSHLQARFGDGIVPMVLLGPWMTAAGAALRPRLARAVAVTGPIVLLALMCAAFVPINEIPHELDTASLTGSPAAALRRFASVKQELSVLPPTDWQQFAATDTLVAARYLSECTAPGDFVLIATYADEVPYFARRHFAGGQAYFAFSFLRSDADQQLAIRRLKQQSVPVVLTWVDYQGEIVRNYPLLADYLKQHYREVGMIDAHGSPFVRVWVDSSRPPRGVDPHLGFPCFR